MIIRSSSITQKQNTEVCNGKFRSIKDRKKKKTANVKTKGESHADLVSFITKELPITNLFLETVNKALYLQILECYDSPFIEKTKPLAGKVDFQS
jgi:hypothetical protein